MTMKVDELSLVSSVCTECGAPVEFELGSAQIRCGHCDAGLVVDKGQRLVRLSCPACQGNFYSLDGSMTGRCPYCGATLLALCHDRVLQYLFKPALLAPEETEGATLVFLPFWHLSGLVYGFDVGIQVSIEQDFGADLGSNESMQTRGSSVMRKESGPKKVFRSRVVDIAMPDPATAAFGVQSLRWRSAIFPMEPYCDEHEGMGRIVRPTLAVDSVRMKLIDRAMTMGGCSAEMNRIDCQRLDLVSQELSLFFYPFWARRDQEGCLHVWDGVTGDLEVRGSGTTPPAPGPTSVFDDLMVVELRCANCGGDLLPGNRAAVLPCLSCGAFYRVTRDGLGRFEARYAQAQLQAEQGRVLWLPFWKVPTEVSFCNRRASTVKDLVNNLGVMSGNARAQRAVPNSPLHYYVAAYGSMRAPRVDHAARDMTRVQPELISGPGGAGERYHCFFDRDDSREMAYVTWLEVLPSSVAHQVRSLRIATREPALWYIPFEQRGRELVSLVTGTAYERATFRGVSH